MNRIYVLIFLLMCSGIAVYGQCAEEQTITVCDITIIDGDADGTPDGIINLYDELSAVTGTVITPANGTWLDPGFNFALNTVSGDLFLFDLPNSSEADTDYQFQLLDPSSGCPDDIRYLFNVVVGPFSGVAAATAAGGVNLQVCQSGPPSACEGMTDIDLFQTLQSNPSPQVNGEWVYMGSSPNFIEIVDGRFLNVNVPYVPGPPLVDEEIFELEYRVPGIVPCSIESITNVFVSVTREAFAGFGNQLVICESEILAGNFDLDVDLRDDAFLVNENIEGIFDQMEPTGQISNPGDSMVNLRQIYNNLIATNPEFGCFDFEFNYSVEDRSAICTPDELESTINFTFYEFIRPFSQGVVPEICVRDDTNTTINLYDSLIFAQEGAALFDYPDDSCTNWTFVSGPSDLGLVSNSGEICDIDPVLDAEYTSQGTIDVSQLTEDSVGTYVFEFTVDREYHCPIEMATIFESPDGCMSVTQEIESCDSQTTRVTLVINDDSYAGEDTEGVEVCEVTTQVDLISLLDTNGVDTISLTGVWTDAAGAVIANPFVFPVNISISESFEFTYTTSTADCMDEATLSFTVFEQFDAGIGAVLPTMCPVGTPFNLFDELTGTPNTNGTWSGPGGFTTTDNVAFFDPNVDLEGDYIYSTLPNEACLPATATVTISFFPDSYAGEDTANVEVCETSGSVDLVSLLATNGIDTVAQGGIWTDAAGTVIANPFTVPTNVSGSVSFDFTYSITTVDGCNDEATLSFAVFEELSAGIGSTLPTMCPVGAPFDLFDELTGMPDTSGTWSGPGGFATTDNVASFDPNVDLAGSYIYTIPATGGCDPITSTIVVNLFAGSYAGEDTVDAQVCEDSVTIDLVTLLGTNGVDVITQGGVWTDAAGVVVANPFSLPTNVTGSISFDFTYSTTTVNGCVDQSSLNFSVFERNEAGLSTQLSFCANEGVINLFDQLGSTADTNGVWTGPNGFTASGEMATVDLSTATSGDYLYTIAANGACSEDTAVVDLTVFELSNAGEDVDTFICPGDFILDLATLLDLGVTTGGEFMDLQSGLEVPDGMINIGLLPDGSYSYLYVVSNGTCEADDSTITFSLTTSPLPILTSDVDFFCINDAASLSDINVDGVEEFAWFAFATGGNELSLSTLLVNGVTYFAQGIDDNGCLSDRVPYTAVILSLGSNFCMIDDIPDGVSDNDDGTNDELTLGVLPQVFPNFNIEIFNRYGTIVYRGNINTSLFDGVSNRGPVFGDRLPTGVYFYIFNPNDGVNSPIDGNFYLSR